MDISHLCMLNVIRRYLPTSLQVYIDRLQPITFVCSLDKRAQLLSINYFYNAIFIEQIQRSLSNTNPKGYAGSKKVYAKVIDECANVQKDTSLQ